MVSVWVKLREEELNILGTQKEVTDMRKTLLTVFLIFLSVVISYGIADAISGVCSNCHTMHNSQNGVSITGGLEFQSISFLRTIKSTA